MEKTKGYRALITSVQSFFKRLVNFVTENADTSSDFGVSEILNSQSVNKLDTVLNTRFQALEVAIANGTVKETLRGTALREIKQGLTPKAKTFLKNQALERATSISSTVKERMVNIAKEIAAKDGDLLAFRQALLEAFQGELTTGKINTIAVTEYRSAYNYGQNHAVEALDEKVSEDNQKVVRTWTTAGDEDVRESHQQVDGEERDVGENFSNGLLHPCDPNGSPEDVINCRCSLEIKVVEKDSGN